MPRGREGAALAARAGVRRRRRANLQRGIRGPVNEIVTYSTFWTRFQCILRYAEAFLANEDNLVRVPHDAKVHAARIRVLRERLPGMQNMIEPHIRDYYMGGTARLIRLLKELEVHLRDNPVNPYPLPLCTPVAGGGFIVNLLAIRDARMQGYTYSDLARQMRISRRTLYRRISELPPLPETTDFELDNHIRFDHSLPSPLII